MKRLLYVLLIAPACYGGERNVSGKCPPGETCSPTTPYGLDFVPPPLFDTVIVPDDTQIAVGGTMPIDLEAYADAISTYPLDMPYTADDGGGPAVRVAATSGNQVTLRGAAIGSNELRILDASDGTLLDRKPFAASQIASIALAPYGFEHTANSDVVYAVPAAHVGIVLAASTGARLVDTSLTVAGAAPKGWDTYDVATPAPGTYSIAVTAGSLPAVNVDVVAVDHADTIVAIDPPASISATNGTEVCFGAELAGKSVVGLTWQITVDGAAAQPALLSPDCGIAQTAKTSGTVTIAATAGGASATFVVPVAAAKRSAPAAPVSDFRGERAASL